MKTNVIVAAVLTVAFAAGRSAGDGARKSPAGAATVYTANTDGGASVLDAATVAPAHADVSTPNGSNAVAVSPDGLRVYVANGISVTVIDAVTNEPITSVGLATAGNIDDLVVSPDGSKVYATSSGDGDVIVLDAASLTKGPVFALDTISGNAPKPEAIDISADGTALFVLAPSNDAVVKLSAADGHKLDGVGVSPSMLELKVSADGSTLIVVGVPAPMFFSTSTLDPVAGASTADIGEQIDLAVAGPNVYVLNDLPTLPPPPAKNGPKTTVSVFQPTIDMYVAATGAYVKSFPLAIGVEVLGIAVPSDGSQAFVSGYPGEVTAVDLTTGVLGPQGETGTYPRRVAVKELSPETPVASYFLPRNINLKLKGAGKDSLIAAGFYDDGGTPPDYTQPVTIEVGTFTKTFTPVPKGTGFFSPKDPVVKFFILPNLRGSSRGRFKMILRKTTLAGLVDPSGAVPFHFRATGLPDAQGSILLTAGRYTLGKKRGALVTPQFFPRRAAAKVGGANADSLAFVGGFATDGTTPAALTSVRFGFGPAFLRVIPGAQFKKAGDSFTFKSRQGKTTFSIQLDFLREQVTVSGSKIELGNLDTGTIKIVLDAGTGAGAYGNVVRIASKKTTRFY